MRIGDLLVSATNENVLRGPRACRDAVWKSQFRLEAIASIKRLGHHPGAVTRVYDNSARGPCTSEVIGTQREEVWLVGYHTALEYENINWWRRLRRDRFAPYFGTYNYRCYQHCHTDRENDPSEIDHVCHSAPPKLTNLTPRPKPTHYLSHPQATKCDS